MTVDRKNRLTRLAGIVAALGLAFYAAQHPHTPAYYLIKFILTPIPV